MSIGELKVQLIDFHAALNTRLWLLIKNFDPA